jgi:hypothetical protein
MVAMVIPSCVRQEEVEMFGSGSKTRETQDDAKWNTRNRIHPSVRFFREELGALQKIPLRIGTPRPTERGSRVFGVPKMSARSNNAVC